MQYVILHNLFQCRMTILGDYAQTLDTKQHDVLKFLPKIFGKDIRKVILNKSYRNTYEIAKYAAQISGITGLELLERHGRPVEERTFASEDEMLDAIEANVNLGLDGYETGAVITMTEDEAYDIYRLLKNRGVDAAYVDRDSSAFKRGLTVTTFIWQRDWNSIRYLPYEAGRKIRLQNRRNISLQQGRFRNCMCMRTIQVSDPAFYKEIITGINCLPWEML